jgi:subtilisin family serine protease
LSAAATANINIDIDQVGDVPTGCTSPFIVKVTNTTAEGRLSDWAAWGATMVEIGAPGTDILSLVPSNHVMNMTGTSMATPHVTGAIALLHSAASADFNQLYNSDPATASIKLKAMLLSTATPQEDLQGKVVSGGRLNLAAAVDRIRDYVAEGEGPHEATVR